MLKWSVVLGYVVKYCKKTHTYEHLVAKIAYICRKRRPKCGRKRIADRK